MTLTYLKITGWGWHYLSTFLGGYGSPGPDVKVGAKEILNKGKIDLISTETFVACSNDDRKEQFRD